MRYDTPDEEGETRRERNARFEVESPEFEPPFGLEHLWFIFWEISQYRSRSDNGPMLLRPKDFLEWEQALGHPLRKYERQIFTVMDRAYISAWYDEMKSQRERREADAKFRKENQVNG